MIKIRPKNSIKLKRLVVGSLVAIFSVGMLPNWVSADRLVDKVENQQEIEVPKEDEPSVEVPKEEEPNAEVPKEDEPNVEVPKEDELSVEVPVVKDETNMNGINSPTTFDGELDLKSGLVSGVGISSTGIISTSGTYRITGTTSSISVTVKAGVIANVVLDNVNQSTGMKVESGSEVNLYLIGTNTMNSRIHIPVGAKINILGGYSNTGTLIGNGGIGSFGFEDSGDINITGGKLKLDVRSYGAEFSAIGGGPQGSRVGDITIGGNAEVEAIGAYNAAGIGEGSTAIYGNGAIKGIISITDNAKVIAEGGQYCAGIGSSINFGSNSVGMINISGNADVTSKGVNVGLGGINESLTVSGNPAIKVFSSSTTFNVAVKLNSIKGTEAVEFYYNQAYSKTGDVTVILKKVGNNKGEELIIPKGCTEFALLNLEAGDYQLIRPELDGYIYTQDGITYPTYKSVSNKVPPTLGLYKVDPPAVMKGVDDVSIKIGDVDTFDYLRGVTVEDLNVDNTIPIVPTITGTIGKPALGKVETYNITYTAVDSGGNVTSKIRKITVKNLIPAVIHGADDITIKVGEVDTFDLLKGVTVTDDKDKGLVATTTGSLGKPSEGMNETYDITYEVIDSDGNVTTKARKITVTNQKPIINGLSDIIIIEGQTADLQSGVTANDNEDGAITGSIAFPIVDLKTLTKGTHEIEYSVVDSDGNITNEKRNVKVEEILDLIVIPSGIILIKDASGIAIKKEEIELIPNSLNGSFEIKTNPIIELEVNGDKVEVEVFNEVGNKIGVDRVLGEVKRGNLKEEFTLRAPLKNFKNVGIYKGNITFEIEYKEIQTP